MADNSLARLNAYRKKKLRSQRIDRISRKLSGHAEWKREVGLTKGTKKPFVRKERKGRPRERKLIAYDLETTRIKKGTPKPLYLTAYGETFSFSNRIDSLLHLGQIIRDRFLTEENKGARFIAWNGNKFDVFFICAALLHDENFILRPYLTRTKNLRGVKITSRENDKLCWEFLDGISMTGIQKKLKDFLKTFAPEYQKLDGPDFEKEEFNANNTEHVRYAERDSEGLYYALINAQIIVKEHFNLMLQPTIGNLGIKAFQSFIPMSVTVWEPPFQAKKAIRDYAMRGGFCFCVKKYEGPVWKYDINQAYAAAMRESWLPSGRCFSTKRIHPYARCGVYRIKAQKAGNKIPFYYRDITSGKSVFGVDTIDDTWITSIEVDQLQKEGWKIELLDGWAWEDGFQMREYVDKLEYLRIGEGRDPKSAQGEMMKALGNNSYGKTVETLDGIELVMSAECPDGYYNYQAEDEQLQHIWFRFGAPVLRDYHQPHIGTFITAYVRMVVRRAALTNPEGWIYADTDCVIFDSPAHLPIDPKLYGYWKIEEEGTNYRIIAKKVYAEFGAPDGAKHAKGLNIKRLTDSDFIEWFNGRPPSQTQIQRQNFLKVMTGFDMFIERTKVGQKMS